MVSNAPQAGRWRPATPVPYRLLPARYGTRLAVAAVMLVAGLVVMVVSGSGVGVDIGTVLFVVGLVEEGLALAGWLGYLLSRRAWWARDRRHRAGGTVYDRRPAVAVGVARCARRG